MMDIRPLLESLISVSGISGSENPARKIIENAWHPFVDELTVSRLGSLHGLKKGSGPDPRPKILLAAHMDAIGLMVTSVVDGFLRVTNVGGIDPRILPGQPVVVHGAEDLPGVIVQPPTRQLPPTVGSHPVPLEYLWVDVGLHPEGVAQLVRPGNLVSFAQAPLEMAGNTLGGHSLDNRASVAALTICLDELQRRIHTWDVLAVATAQEEVGSAGALTSAFELKPDLAVAIDVTFGKGPGSTEYTAFTLGKELTLGWGPDIHSGFHQMFKDVADELEIPYAIEVMPLHSGTDSFSMQVTEAGIPNMVLSIPLRYMHTPVEVVSLKDIRRAGRLLTEVITHLQPDSMQHIRWDD